MGLVGSMAAYCNRKRASSGQEGGKADLRAPLKHSMVPRLRNDTLTVRRRWTEGTKVILGKQKDQLAGGNERASIAAVTGRIR